MHGNYRDKNALYSFDVVLTSLLLNRAEIKVAGDSKFATFKNSFLFLKLPRDKSIIVE